MSRPRSRSDGPRSVTMRIMRRSAPLAWLALLSLGCDDADLVACGAGGVHEQVAGVEYCVYPGADADVRCPAGTTLVGRFEGGIVCASRPVPAGDDITDRACRHLEGGCDRPVVLDAGVDAALDTGADGASVDARVGDGALDDASDAAPPACMSDECNDIVEVEAGSRTTCARVADGSVYCWGTDVIVDGAIEPRTSATRVPALAGLSKLSIAFAHACGIDDEGAAWCWGENRYGVLGPAFPDSETSAEPVLMDLPEPASEIATGRFHTCALGSSGSVYCWGINEQLELGDATRGASDARPRAVPGVTGVIGIATTSHTTCALREDAGSRVVTCWGGDGDGQVGSGGVSDTGRPPTDGLRAADLAEVAAGSRHTCTRRTGGTVDCWGSNGVGETGDPSPTNPQLAPFRVVDLAAATALDAGTSFSCVIAGGGGVRCWGVNAADASQLGAASGVAFSATPLDVRGVANATYVATGTNHACAVVDGREVRCWGLNDSGQLGNGETAPAESAPVVVVGLP